MRPDHRRMVQAVCEADTNGQLPARSLVLSLPICRSYNDQSAPACSQVGACPTLLVSARTFYDNLVRHICIFCVSKIDSCSDTRGVRMRVPKLLQPGLFTGVPLLVLRSVALMLQGMALVGGKEDVQKQFLGFHIKCTLPLLHRALSRHHGRSARWRGGYHDAIGV